MARFLFLLAKAALSCLPTAHFVELRPLSPFRQAHFVQVFRPKSAPFCKLFTGLGNTNKSVIYLLFSFSLTHALSLPLCLLLHLFCYLKLSVKSVRNCLLFSPVLSGYNGSRSINFSQGTTRLISWPDEERCSCPLQSLLVSLLSPIVSTFLSSRTGGALSHLNSLALWFPRCP